MPQSDKRNFTGKVVLITGASSGIGAATAVEFARRGALVTITGRNAEGLEKTAQECKKASPTKHEPLSIMAELSNTKDVEKIFNDTIKANGRLDVLINNAGISGNRNHVADQNLDSFDEVVAVNLRAPFYLIKLAIPELEKTKGSIVNVSSSTSKMAIPSLSIYAMLKSAMDHFTKSLAVELGPKGIRVNAMNPGSVPTNFGRPSDIPKEVLEKLVEAIVRKTPLKALGTTEDIALSIAFLASEEAAFVTGTCFVADGGLRLSSPLDLRQQ